jgi:ferric-dicitrate binding protein FerR (iron transport regulator)
VEVLKSADSDHFVLAPNQMLTITDGHATMEEAEAYTYIAWKDGLLYFNGTTLGEALSWLAKQYAVDISCTPKSASLKLYGKLILEEHVESVLDNLTVIEPIAYEVRNNQVIVRYDKE